MNKLYIVLTGVLVALVACSAEPSAKVSASKAVSKVKVASKGLKAKTYRAPSIAKTALPRPSIRASFGASTAENVVFGYTDLKARQCPAPAVAYPTAPAGMKVFSGRPNLKHYITYNGQVVAHAAFKTRKLHQISLRVNNPAPGEYKYVTRAVQPCKYYVNGKLRFKFYLQSRQLTRTAVVAATVPTTPGTGGSVPEVITNPEPVITDPTIDPIDEEITDENLGFPEDSSDFVD
jgi:hypothetical protein